MDLKIYDNIIPASVLSQIDTEFTRKLPWNFLVDAGPGDSQCLGNIIHRENFGWIENYLLGILDKNGINTSSINRRVNNCYRRLDKPRYHVDPGETSYMFYVNSEWKRHWGAPTKFKSKLYHLSRKVYPKPGRMVAFSSRLFHKGTSPNFFMPSSTAGRFSLVFQQYDPNFSYA